MPELENYAKMYEDMIITLSCSQKRTRAALLAKIVENKLRYILTSTAVSRQPSLPWEFIAVVHAMESGCDFSTHLHNGDPLTGVTSHVPAGRPILKDENGKLRTGPFLWEESAVDALMLRGLNTIKTWDVPKMLYELERYNGLGYKRRNINTPYLWAGTNLYTKGKYVKDGVFDPNAVSKQVGAAVLLKDLIRE